VQVCETYLESPLACASGITGADLKKRIREIMTWRRSLPVTLRAKAMLAVATLAAVSIPFVIGILRAQTLPPAPAFTYEAVSIHKSDPTHPSYYFGIGPQGGWRADNISVINLILFAYDTQEYRVIGAPAWVSSQHYDVTFTADKSENSPGATTPMNRNKQRLQAVLRDRFDLVLRAETRQLPVYALTVAKSGLKLRAHDSAEAGPWPMQNNRSGHLISHAVTLDMIARDLSDQLDRPVIQSGMVTTSGPVAGQLSVALLGARGSTWTQTGICQGTGRGVRDREDRTSERELSAVMNEILNHLWQSTAFAAAELSASALLAVAGGVDEVPDSFLAVGFDGLASSHSAWRSRFPCRDGRADLHLLCAVCPRSSSCGIPMADCDLAGGIALPVGSLVS
jgi:uncharacterized protein (TIGR03435 family)